MAILVTPGHLEQARRAVVRGRSGLDRHRYFRGVAQARYVLRKVFRLIEAQAKQAGIDPLAHQGLIQIYGSPKMTLQVKELAERLDIAQAFASSLINPLIDQGYAIRRKGGTDQRVVRIAITRRGINLLHHIDEEVQKHVDSFTSRLSKDERQAAVSILMFYIGISLHRRDAAGPRRANDKAT